MTNLLARQIARNEVQRPFVPVERCMPTSSIRKPEPSLRASLADTGVRIRAINAIFQQDFQRAQQELLAMPSSQLRDYFLGCAEIGLEDYQHGLSAWQRTSVPTMPLQEVGEYLLEMDRPADALPFFEVASRMAPDKASMFVYLANIYMRLGEKQQAIEAIEHAALLQPNDFVVLVTLGGIRSSINKRESAIDAFRRAIAVDPHRGSDPYARLAELLLQSGTNESEAMETLAVGLDIWPTDPALVSTASHAMEYLGQTEAASYWQQQAVGTTHDPVPGELLRGMTHMYAGDFIAARKTFDAILTRFPTHSGALTWRSKSIQGELQ